MTTDITELVQRARINAECGEHLSPAETMELVEALESEKRICATWRKTAKSTGEKLEKAQRYIEELREWNFGLAQESFERQQRIADLEESNAQVIQSRDHYKRMTEEGLKQLAESRTVKLPKLKMLEDYLAEVAIEERKQILVGVKLEFHRALAAAGIKVEAE